ncbi:hypothetical protein P8452_16538 [Trifolium repens]|nr:hypothetical protein P8452_16538 [Trifolium repens]
MAPNRVLLLCRDCMEDYQVHFTSSRIPLRSHSHSIQSSFFFVFAGHGAFQALQALVPFQALQAFANQLSVCQNFMDK